MNNLNSDKEPIDQKGCLFIGLFVFIIIWVVGVTIVAQLTMWIMEQTLFEAAFLVPDLRWLIISMYVILVGSPLILFRFIFNDPQRNSIYRFWLTILLLGIFSIPGRFFPINDANIVSIIQMIGVSIYLGILLYIFRRQNVSIQLKSKPDSIFITIIIAGVYFLPWVMWGALGSPLDLGLNLLAGILSGLFLTFSIQQLFSKLFPENRIINPGRKMYFGFIVFIGLILFSTVFGQNGQQWMLVLTLPLAGWLIAGLFKNEGGDQRNFKSVWLLLSVTIAAPLIWFDPDELSLLIGSESGEIFSWVGQSISYSIAILILSSIIFSLLRKKVYGFKNTKALFGISVFVWVGVLMVYFWIGQPGFFGESLFVIMAEQVDLGEADLIHDPIQKRLFVYQTSTDFASNSQAELIDFLRQFRIEYDQYYLVNAIEVKAGPFWKWVIGQRGDVDRVLDNPYLRPLPEEIPVNTGNKYLVKAPLWNLEMLGVNKVWEEFDVRGEGIIVGQADSGVDGDHPALKEQFAGSKENANYSWFDPWFGSNYPKDISGHGTHTLGIILGKEIGLAPEAKWIGCVNLGRNLGNPGYYLSCMQFLFAPFPENGDSLTEGKPELGANIFNNSWGCPEIEGCDAQVFEQAVYALKAGGIFVVSSAGNNGYYGCESISDPLAIYQDVLTVGAINKMREIAPFSSLGPVSVDGSGRIKPDLVAPGVDVFSSMPNASYAILSGTSMAGPHVVGTVALMWSANPELIGQIDLTEEILIKTASDYDGIYPGCVNKTAEPNSAVGFGILNTFKAVEEAIKIR